MFHGLPVAVPPHAAGLVGELVPQRDDTDEPAYNSGAYKMFLERTDWEDVV
jgi:hypothetical protein